MNYLLKGVSLLAIASLGVSPSLADGHDDKATDEVVVEGKVLYSDQVNALKNTNPYRGRATECTNYDRCGNF